MGSSVNRMKLTPHVIGADRCQRIAWNWRIAWNYNCKEQTTEMTEEATATCRLVREQAGKEGREKGTKEGKELNKDVGKLTFV
jgi:hypothetical protein